MNFGHYFILLWVISDVDERITEIAQVSQMKKLLILRIFTTMAAGYVTVKFFDMERFFITNKS